MRIRVLWTVDSSDACKCHDELTDRHLVLETERLTLRRLLPNDVDAIFAVIGDPDRDAVLSANRFSAKTRRSGSNGIFAVTPRTGYGLYAMVLKATGDVIGDCGLVIAGDRRRAGAGSWLPSAPRSLGPWLCDRSGAWLHGLRISDARCGKSNFADSAGEPAVAAGRRAQWHASGAGSDAFRTAASGICSCKRSDLSRQPSVKDGGCDATAADKDFS